jgi:hypothetical protein
MKVPTFKDLAADGKGGSFARGMHPNPYFYKYYWWIFHEGSPCEGMEFLEDEFRIPFREAFELTEHLRALGKPFWMYNRKLPRADWANTPWDPDAHAWKDQEWAPPFDADPDPIHPNGHR